MQVLRKQGLWGKKQITIVETHGKNHMCLENKDIERTQSLKNSEEDESRQDQKVEMELGKQYNEASSNIDKKKLEVNNGHNLE